MHVSQKPSSDLTTSAQTFFNDAVTTVVEIKKTGGLIYALDLMNGAAATSYLQVFFQPAALVTLGTTRPDAVIKLPTNAGSGFSKTFPFPVPIGGLIPLGTATAGSLGMNLTGPGRGLSVAGTTTPTGASAAAIGVTAFFF